MLKYLHETTSDWTTDFKMPGHIYMLDGTTCVGYIQQGTDSETWFAHPLKNFDKRKRTFNELNTDKALNTVIDGWLA